ncbi:hypothetical protein KKJ09_19285 [Xenorhabdus bovienii]|uniref:hypothetical protein n=1 Tax=Xenorhabdus bovienii TaxID=40576 RepID=UPI0023B2C89B|nr:hypothetical protein [Xenorhabdus bovienii]MDE9495666.1 hypothetical protein [Xenorhabdus bovienii]MDE9504067.1 hypothetical protein [Xenorhabdus bovienii]MDE9570999.1 hypothetical protein [Xenorhabdus bovienii]
MSLFIIKHNLLFDVFFTLLGNQGWKTDLNGYRPTQRLPCLNRHIYICSWLRI